MDPTEAVDVTDGGASEVRVTWEDGHVSVFRFAWLRTRCPCAQCHAYRRAGETVWPRDRAGDPLAIRPRLTVRDAQLVGAGLQPVWSDGHRTGIYGFSSLRASCPCEACAAGSRVVAAPPLPE